MKVLEYVEELYETAKPGSMDFILSEYLLMHTEEIIHMSLSDLAKETGIIKPTVATYFKASAIPGGYVSFKKEISSDLGSHIVSIKRCLRWGKDLVQVAGKQSIMSVKDMNELCRKMISSGKVLLIGEKRYCQCMMTLICFLRSRNIKTRYICDACMQKYEAELCTLGEKDLVLFLAPDETYMEYHLKMIGKPQYSSAYQKCTGERIYLCSSNKNQTGKVQVFPVNTKENPHLRTMSLIYLNAVLFQRCVEMSGVDVNEKIFMF